PEECFSIAVFRIDYFIPFTEQYNEKDRRLLRFALANIVKESLQTVELNLETVDMGYDHIAVVLFCQVDRLAFIGKLYESQQLVKQYLSIDTTVALGKQLEHITEVHEGYLDTYELTQERFGLGHGHVIAREQIPSAPTEMYHLPIEKERQMAQAIQKANIETVIAILHTSIANIRERSYFECKMSLITLFMQIRRLIQEQVHQVLPSSWGLTSVENQIIQLEVLDDVVPWIEGKLIQSIKEIADARSISRNAVLIEQVDRLIDDYLTDSNLSSKLLADELELSVITCAMYIKRRQTCLLPTGFPRNA
ncbi:MAG: hypothetical protein K6T85_02380, partial [Gorillibacterium sp.]|nr:hypothetical protein [Gorillibacterium sp.]